MNEQIKAIRAEIKRLQKTHEGNLNKPMERGRIGYAHGVVACCDKILSFIDSLPEEPDKSLEEAVEKHINEALFKWIYDDEDGIEQYVHDSFIAGANWQKEQMMKEAVEAVVNTYELTPGGSTYVEFVVDMPVARFKFNDKVRIIIVKEDER